ncbi:hypothetical protein G6F16_009626 [Rhizopus arrhizus]|nr:hypothetical protein G6F22_007436 [Rhizopus arrhizus]KAG0828716.1 hypothetical protein G6F19_008098 [Rhizopus arrhizus]KAG0866233.1 hypothetical protein G6F16_009626 [Rhizopus arrhizus]KAG1223467.1 hypothetical protein G6F35_004645 [Rhizopus arrhizus]
MGKAGSLMKVKADAMEWEEDADIYSLQSLINLNKYRESQVPEFDPNDKMLNQKMKELADKASGGALEKHYNLSSCYFVRIINTCVDRMVYILSQVVLSIIDNMLHVLDLVQKGIFLSRKDRADGINMGKAVYMITENTDDIPYSARKANSSNGLNEEEAVADLADNNNLKSQEAYRNVALRLLNKPSFEKYKNNPEILNGIKLD